MLRGRYGVRLMLLAWLVLVVALALLIWGAMKLSALLFGGSTGFM